MKQKDQAEWSNEMADKCEQAWKLDRLGEMYNLLKEPQKRGE